MTSATLPHNGTPTSAAAAKSPKTIRTAELHRRSIILLLRCAPAGRTCDELEQDMGIPHQSCSARLTELAAAGRVMHVGTRPTRTGNPARVYILGPAER